jgi:hypothetical protein
MGFNSAFKGLRKLAVCSTTNETQLKLAGEVLV